MTQRRTFVPLLTLAVLSLAFCALEASPGPGGELPAAERSTEAGAPGAALDCPPMPRGAEALVARGSFVLVGEVHGTAEAPAFVAALACAAARKAGEGGVVVGIEMSHADQSALDAFFAAESPAAARSELLSATNFTDAWLDGRDSRAVVALLEDLRRWRRAGSAIAVVAFDVAADDGAIGDAREAAMAERVAAAAERHPGATILVYTGNLHSRTAKGVPWDSELLPMGARLQARYPHLRSVDFASAGGTSWTCIMVEGGQQECGVRRQGGVDRGERPFVELWDEPDDHGYHGIYYLGPITASPPAGPDDRAEP